MAAHYTHIYTNMHTATARMSGKRGRRQDGDGWGKQTAKRLKCESWKICQSAFSRP